MKKIVFVCLLLLGISCAEKKELMEPLDVFVGTYTDGDSEGIYRYSFDPNTGQLQDRELMASLPNPSFLAISKDKKNLYAVQETADFDSIGGGVTAFALKDGKLELLNSKGSGGAHPCHVSVSNKGQLAASNFSGGNFSVFDLNEDGSLGERQLVSHKPTDTLKNAYVHKAHFNSDGLFVSDLGLSAIKRYTKQPYGWVPATQHTIAMGDGAGSRHFVFNGDRTYMYVINELNATIVVLKRDGEGNYTKIQTENTLAPDWEGVKSCADIHLSPNGKFLYGSNRGENTIVIFSVDKDSGMLSLLGRESVRGDWPRNFTMDPSGEYLLVANQKSDNITIFKRDAEKGTLSFLHEVATPAPVCLVFK